jgi:hypothetical protein
MYFEYKYLFFEILYLSLQNELLIFLMMQRTDKIKVGIVGTGAIARGLVKLLSTSPEMTVSGVLTRRIGAIDGLEVPNDMVLSNSGTFIYKI